MRTHPTPFVAAIFVILAQFSERLYGEGQNSPPEVAVQARQVLSQSCWDCHGRPGRQVRGRFGNILDRDGLIRDNRLVLERPNDSLIYQRMVDRTEPMPPVGHPQQPSTADVDIIRRWILAGAPRWAPTVSQGVAAASSLVTPAEVLRAVVRDLTERPAADRPFQVYFSFVHFSNMNPMPVHLDTLKAALIKTVNFLSSGSAIRIPAAVGDLALFRLDRRQMGWGEEIWREVKGRDPHFFALMREIPGISREAVAATVRGDWFISNVSRGEFYSRFLTIPNTEAEFTNRLGINIAENIRQDRVMRSGFGLSGTEANNRIIERHRQQGTSTNSSPNAAARENEVSYWRSYNFDTNLGAGNIFTNPLGPQAEANSFQHADSDVIFQLPNGLHGYFTVDPQGRKTAEANVNTGLKCLTCHIGGFLYRADEVRPAFEARRELEMRNPFFRTLFERVSNLYSPRDTFRDRLRQDNRRFQEATEAMNLPLSALPQGRQAPTAQGEPVNIVANAYQSGEVSIQNIAAELGVTEPELVGRIRRGGRGVSSALSPLLVMNPRTNVFTGSVRRDVLEPQVEYLVISQYRNPPQTANGLTEATRLRSGVYRADGPGIEVADYLPNSPHPSPFLIGPIQVFNYADEGRDLVTSGFSECGRTPQREQLRAAVASQTFESGFNQCSNIGHHRHRIEVLNETAFLYTRIFRGAPNWVSTTNAFRFSFAER